MALCTVVDPAVASSPPGGTLEGHRTLGKSSGHFERGWLAAGGWLLPPSLTCLRNKGIQAQTRAFGGAAAQELPLPTRHTTKNGFFWLKMLFEPREIPLERTGYLIHADAHHDLSSGEWK